MTEVIISFPGIGIDAFSVDKVAFELPFFGGLEVRWYGIILTLGIIAGLCYALYRTKTEGISTDDIMDYALWTVVLAIIGARLYYVLTTLKDSAGNWNYHSFTDVIAIWNGGIAMYGSVLTKETLLRCGARFVSAMQSKTEILAYLERIRSVDAGKTGTVSDAFFCTLDI